MGMRRSPSSSLETLASMSPTVATRAAAAMVWADTPRREASSCLGRTTSSAALGGVAGRGSAMPFTLAHLSLQIEGGLIESHAGLAGEDHLHAGGAEAGGVEGHPRVGDLAQERRGAGRGSSPTLVLRSGLRIGDHAAAVDAGGAGEAAARAAAGAARADGGEHRRGLRAGWRSRRSTRSTRPCMSSTVAPGGASMLT